MFFYFSLATRAIISLTQLTIVHVRYLPFEKHQAGKAVYAVLLRFVQVTDFHESYVVLIAVVVDVLQLAQHLLTLLLILVVCRINDQLSKA